MQYIVWSRKTRKGADISQQPALQQLKVILLQLYNTLLDDRSSCVASILGSCVNLYQTERHLQVTKVSYLIVQVLIGQGGLYLKIISHKGTISYLKVIQIQDSFITYIVWSFVSDVQGALQARYSWISIYRSLFSRGQRCEWYQLSL